MEQNFSDTAVVDAYEQLYYELSRGARV
jgi:hypothetical protein